MSLLKFDMKSVLLLSSMFLFTACLDQAGTIIVKDMQPGAVTTPPTSGPTNLVCDALNGAGMVSDDPTAGLLANLFYLEDSQPRYTAVNDYMLHGTRMGNVSIYFNQVNVPTRPFDRGFYTNEGQVLVNNKGNTLYEYFGLEFQSDLVLTPQDVEGNYQFAVLSDDGSILAHRDTSGGPAGVIVNNDINHPTKFGCATTPVFMGRQTRLPINFRYYQGPRYHIAAIIMFRPWPTDSNLVNDVECGQSGNSRYFDSTQDPPAPQAAYNGLLARGWKVLQPQNYKVPQGVENACNAPAPTISNGVVSNVSSTAAQVTWSTNIPASSLVEFTVVEEGLTSVTPYDTSLVTSHTIQMQNLRPNTLYSVVPISASVSGRLTRGSEITFRTAP